MRPRAFHNWDIGGHCGSNFLRLSRWSGGLWRLPQFLDVRFENVEPCGEILPMAGVVALLILKAPPKA